MGKNDSLVRIDLNNLVFQEPLFLCKNRSVSWLSEVFSLFEPKLMSAPRDKQLLEVEQTYSSQLNAAIDILRKIRQLSWGQFYRDTGLKWEKIISVKPPQGIDAIYSLRITQSRRCTAYRNGDFLRLLTVAPDCIGK